MPPQTYSKVWRSARLGNSELLLARHCTHAFPRHTHDQYAIGVIEQGALGYFYRGENVVAVPGDINLCIPGEVHNGYPAASTGWTYRMFYFDAHLLEQVASEIAGYPRPLPFFAGGTIADPAIAHQLRFLHMRLETGNTPALDIDTTLLAVLSQLVIRHADDQPAVTTTGQEQRAVMQVKDYLESHYAEDISLDDLARITHLSRFHLVRVFSETVGIPPHAYLRQVRVRRAKAQLRLGHTLTEVALSTGFTDQSHLTRWFKRLWGITPGAYRNSVQDITP